MSSYLQRENKENQQADLQISPQKTRFQGPRINLPALQHKNSKENAGSPTKRRERRQLEDLWLKPAFNPNTSLEEEMSDHECESHCDCPKEHILE